MPSFGKPNATGRSSGIYNGRLARLHGPPRGEPWTWLTQRMLASDSLRGLSINAWRVLTFLLHEHCAHAGQENGHLAAPYDQLVRWGVTRSECRRAIHELETAGLIRCVRGGRWAGTNQPSRFRLTFYSDRDHQPATNEWRTAKREEMAAAKKDAHEQARARKARLAKNGKLVRGAELPEDDNLNYEADEN